MRMKMPRRNRSNGQHSTTKQKGRSRRGSSVGSYAKKQKIKNAALYDRPYLTGSYNKEFE